MGKGREERGGEEGKEGGRLACKGKGRRDQAVRVKEHTEKREGGGDFRVGGKARQRKEGGRERR